VSPGFSICESTDNLLQSGLLASAIMLWVIDQSCQSGSDLDAKARRETPLLLASSDGAAEPPRQHALSGLDRSLGARQVQVRRFAPKIFAGRLPGQRFDAVIAHDRTN